ncbi:MAG: energy transducer TonB [Bacteroides sp.]
MINKKGLRRIGRNKCVMSLSLIALLILMSNVEAVARMDADTTKDVFVVDKKEYKDSTKVKSDDSKKSEERIAEFPGGREVMMDYIRTNLKYPKQARKNRVEGRVLIKFVVDKTGEIRDAQVMKSVSKELDDAALSLIQGMPKWKPAFQRGKNVNFQMVIPINFHL